MYSQDFEAARVRRISSALTVFYKRAFPQLFPGCVAVVLTAVFQDEEAWQGAPDRGRMLALGFSLSFFLFIRPTWDLVDEVEERADYLTKTNRGDEERVVLAKRPSDKGTKGLPGTKGYRDQDTQTG